MAVENSLGRFAGWLARPWGWFWSVIGAPGLFVLVGWLTGHPDWFTAFNVFLSLEAIVVGGSILVAGRGSELAIQLKLDRLIEAANTANDAIGVEHAPNKEIEQAKQEIEERAKK